MEGRRRSPDSRLDGLPALPRARPNRRRRRRGVSMTRMIWTPDDIDRAAALVKEHGNAGDAAAELGIRAGTLCEALRVHGKPVKELIEIAKQEYLDRAREH